MSNLTVTRPYPNLNRWRVESDKHWYLVLHHPRYPDGGWIIIGSTTYVHPNGRLGRRILRAVSEFNEKEAA